MKKHLLGFAEWVSEEGYMFRRTLIGTPYNKWGRANWINNKGLSTPELYGKYLKSIGQDSESK